MSPPISLWKQIKWTTQLPFATLQRITTNEGVLRQLNKRKHPWPSQQHKITPTLTNEAALLAAFVMGVIGKKDTQINHTVWTKETLTYADYTASGRSLDFHLKDAIRQPRSAFLCETPTPKQTPTGQKQTHRISRTSTSTIREAVNATAEDLRTFSGSCATSAINTLISQLGLRQLNATETSTKPASSLGPYEHHSNELPWRELGVEIVFVFQEAKEAMMPNNVRRNNQKKNQA